MRGESFMRGCIQGFSAASVRSLEGLNPCSCSSTTTPSYTTLPVEEYTICASGVSITSLRYSKQLPTARHPSCGLREATKDSDQATDFYHPNLGIFN